MTIDRGVLKIPMVCWDAAKWDTYICINMSSLFLKFKENSVRDRKRLAMVFFEVWTFAWYTSSTIL